MKKLFLLIPTLLLTVALNATVINITPTSPYDAHDNLRLALHYANSGDEIVLADGTYLEKDNYLYFDKDITVRAAEGASPVIDMYTYAQIKNAANVRIEGLKFNGAAQGTYDYYFRFYDNTNTSLVLEGCEFYDVKNIVITGKADTHTNSLIVNNCYFHNNAKQSIYFEASDTEGRETCDELTITNSTFANTTALTNWISIIDIRPYGTTVTDAIKVIIDHCTFYNNPCVDSSHANIRTHYLSDVSISNSIFAHPTELAQRAVYCDTGGTVKNCLTFNFTKDTERYGISYGCTIENCALANPLFADAANGDFHLANNWVTMSLSPALGAATDGSDLGDPRWNTPEVLPESNFSTPYFFDGLHARLSGRVELDANNDLKSTNNGSTADGVVTWKIHALRVCKLEAKLNIIGGSGHHYQLEIIDADNNRIGNLMEEADSWENNIDKIFGTITIPEEGDYTIKVYNTLFNSSAILHGVTISYLGGAVQNLPCTMMPVDALRSARAYINEDGEFRFTKDDQTGYVTEEWAKWKMHVTKEGCYKFATHVKSANNQSYSVNIYNNDETVLKGSASLPEEGNYGYERTFSTDAIYLTEGDYIFKVQNNAKWSKGCILDIVATYEHGAIQNIPGEILAEDAMLCKEDGGTLKMVHLENGDIQYNDNGYNLTEYALWNIHATETGEMEVSFNSPSGGHQFRFELYQDETMIGAVEESEANWNHEVTLTDHLTISAAGDYTLKLINKQQYSGGVLHGITFTPYVAPDNITMNDTDTDNSAWIAKKNNTVNVQLNRTILGGMYNTICLPFKVSYAKCKEIFGNDVELYTLGDASLSGDALTLNFNTASDIWNGTPVLIKTSSNIVNPTFTGVKIESETGASTAKDGVTFQGTFVQQEITAGSPVLLLLADNKLALPQSDKTLKGFRAYFRLANPSMVSAIKHARIVTQGQVVTAIDLVGDSKTEKVQKVFVDGQLLIIRDGVQYNTLGTRVK